MNYYELLEISPSASVEVVRNAYKTLAKKYHPDTYKGDVVFAEEKMKLLNEAVSVLENEDKRKEYNMLNGIGQPGYSDYGRNNMLNTDENGEPIFFSYDDAGDPDDEEDGAGRSYMDIIDDYLKNSRAHKKARKKQARKKARAPSPPVNAGDIPVTETGGKGGIEFHYENPAAEDIDLGFGAEPEFNMEPDDAGVFASRGPTDKAKIYYIAVAFLVTAIIILFILIMQSLNLENIKIWMSKVSGGGQDTSKPVLEENMTSGDETGASDFAGGYTTEPAAKPADPQPVTENTIEQNTAGSTDRTEQTTAANNNSTTKATVAPTTKPPAATTKPNAPEATTLPQSTEPGTTIEEITITSVTEEFTTAEISEPETATEDDTSAAPATDDTEPTEIQPTVDTSEADTEPPVIITDPEQGDFYPDD